MKSLTIISLIFLSLTIFFGCENKKNNDSLDLEQIRPKSEMKSSHNQKMEIDSNTLFLSEYKNDSIDLNLSKLYSKENLAFMKRFPSKKNGFRTLLLSDTTQQIEHEFYEYTDSNQMKNAFFNWLDCNGKDCKSIKLYEETKIEPNDVLLIATSKTIDIFRSKTKIKFEDWINFVRFSKKTNEFKFILFQKKNQKAKWYDFNKYKLIPKTKK